MYSLNPLKVRQPRRLFLSSSTCRLSSLSTPPFIELVDNLKKTNKTCTVIESSCGGLISSSLMAVPGSSKVYWGGTIAYNTKKSGKLLVSGDYQLHNRLLDASSIARTIGDNDIEERGINIPRDFSDEAKFYVRSKVISTSETALSYCIEMETDFAIAEGGATGPTFRPEGMNKGFAVLTIAGRKQDGVVDILAQRLCLSTNADRQLNMRLFADASAKLCLEAMSTDQSSETKKPIQQQQHQQIKTDTSEELFLDRSSHIRDDKAIMKDFHQRLDSLHVLLRGTNEVMFATTTDLALPTLKDIIEDKSLISLFSTGGGDATTQHDILKKRTFIGRIGEDKTPVFATTFLPNDAIYDGSYRSCYFGNTRSRAPLLNSLHNELALTSTAYVNWQNTHQFCCTCGAPLEYIHGRTCAKCMGNKTHFHWPRQDPSIICLVTNPAKTHALLARSPRHKPYLYTCLAGFVEAGENFESAVMREVYEEVGVHVDKDSISYFASQPWPFPRSTMIGMHARSSLDVDMAPICIDPNEIVDAQWFDKETVYQAAKHSDEIGAVLDPKVVEANQAKGWGGKLLVPSKGVLARKLVDHWLDND